MDNMERCCKTPPGNGWGFKAEDDGYRDFLVLEKDGKTLSVDWTDCSVSADGRTTALHPKRFLELVPLVTGCSLNRVVYQSAMEEYDAQIAAIETGDMDGMPTICPKCGNVTDMGLFPGFAGESTLGCGNCGAILAAEDPMPYIF